MKKTLDKTPDANRDPITGTPGSHPVGTGIGAAAGGIAAGALFISAATAVLLARQGAKVGIFTALGDDAFGRAFLKVQSDNALFEGVWEAGESHQVWMSHGDRVTAIPAVPVFT